MAGNLVVFDVDDTSPTVLYYPAVHNSTGLSSESRLTGWAPYYTESGYASTMGQEGRGISQHRSSFDGASITLDFTGSGIEILGNAGGNASFSFTLDGALIKSKHSELPDNTLLSLSGLENTLHMVSLTSIIPDPLSILTFDKAVITSTPESNGTTSERTLDDTLIHYEGNWTTEGSLRLSNTQGDVVRTSFRGTSLSVTGSSSPSTGLYSVMLDDTARNYSSTSIFSQENVLLFYVSGLNSSETHDLVITNADGSELALYTTGFLTNSSSDEALPSSSPVPTNALDTAPSVPAGTIAALALAGLLLIVISAAVVYCIRRHTQSPHHPNTGDLDMNEVLNTRPSSFNVIPRRSSHQSGSARSGFARWKSEMEQSFSGLGNGVGITFRKSPTPNRRDGDVWSDDEGQEKEGTEEGGITFSRWSADLLPTLPSDAAWDIKGQTRSLAFPQDAVESSSNSSLSDFVAAPAVIEGRRLPQASPGILGAPPKLPTTELVLDSLAVQAALRDLSPRISETPGQKSTFNTDKLSGCINRDLGHQRERGTLAMPSAQLGSSDVTCDPQARYKRASSSQSEINNNQQTRGEGSTEQSHHGRIPVSESGRGNAECHRRNMSFLDLEVSDVSTNASRQSSKQCPSVRHEASHWSFTTQPSTENSSSSSNAFPFPVSLPPSPYPEGYRSSQLSFAGRLNVFPSSLNESPSLSRALPGELFSSVNDQISRPLPPHPTLPNHYFDSREHSQPRTK